VSVGRVIYLACLERHVLLDRKGDDQLGVRLYGGPLATDLRELLVANKTEVLEFIAWRDEARGLLTADFARIERLYRPGAPLDSSAICAAERELHETFWAQDRIRFAVAVRRWRLACYSALSPAPGEVAP
jgi:hypothetical protein